MHFYSWVLLLFYAVTVLQLMTLFVTSVLIYFAVKIYMNNVLYAFFMFTNNLSNVLDECKLT